MKTKAELKALRLEVEALNARLAELSDDEMKQVVGGLDINMGLVESGYDVVWRKDDHDVENPIDAGEYTASITKQSGT